MSHVEQTNCNIVHLENLKQAILKSVLKSQIQLLVEQLSEQTGEESVLLTANISTGSLSHLGSRCGKHFLDDHGEFKSQFYGFCLKRHGTAKRKTDDIKSGDDVLAATSKRQKSSGDIPASSSLSHTSALDKVAMVHVSTHTAPERLPSSLCESLLDIPAEASHETNFDLDDKLASFEGMNKEVGGDTSIKVKGVVDDDEFVGRIDIDKQKVTQKLGGNIKVAGLADSDDFLGTIDRDRENVSPHEGINKELRGDIKVERVSDKDDFVGRIDKDRVGVTDNTNNTNTIEGVDQCLVIKQEPIEDVDGVVPSLETFPYLEKGGSMGNQRSLYDNWKTKRRRTSGKIPKTSTSSETTEQFCGAGTSTSDPMLADAYLREVLSQITSKTSQLSEIGLDPGVSGYVPPGDKPYRCQLCGRGFTQRGNLEVHMWTQHGNNK